MEVTGGGAYTCAKFALIEFFHIADGDNIDPLTFDFMNSVDFMFPDQSLKLHGMMGKKIMH